jgi:enoyl-CoA hydratase
MEMLLTADWIDAQQAYEFGMLNRVVPHDQVMECALEFANKIEKNGPCAIRAIKESVTRSLGMDLESALGEELMYAAKVFATEDAMEGPKAFAQKRQPQWKGR